ncbi:MAG TPA: bifunctional diaminohydroxyphosphoribosylaminopyrimidine deaminase/5-amino-6-(5-phosphoribosylamino)uracil reductase RibD [Thermoanaerobaculia bacterium]|nr:bifunctional diaminohydroxyphosphoribosylaminopyrimidine deaminase/5-amino-6-(5-phosphoribosylamino)uracil reductase RibD [Thermoanaerobaculia bacterium]
MPSVVWISHLRRALHLAARGRYRTAPNPMVGAVVVRDGEVVGEGWHRQVGGAHAEVEALTAAGERARGATLCVTLEPCNHRGRTPPCTEAVLAAGVARVVACHRDPNPAVAGGGFERLRRAGVEVVEGVLAEEAIRLNLRFLVPAVLGRPLVTLKWAMSLDGRIATAAGESQWISGPAARRWALALREEHDAIVVGSGTALADDPRLDRRLGLAPGPILRVVLDRRLRLSPEARLHAVPGPVLVYAASTPAGEADAAARRRRALEERGAEVVLLDPEAEAPAAVLADLARRGVGSILVEGGGELAAAWVAAGLYDRVHAVVAPLLVGGRAAPGPLGGVGAATLAAAPRLEGLRVRRRGPDLLLTGLRQGCLLELSSSVGAS